MVSDGYVSVKLSISFWRWQCFCKPGKWAGWVFTRDEMGEFVKSECDAVVDDFGSLVGVPS